MLRRASASAWSASGRPMLASLSHSGPIAAQASRLGIVAELIRVFEHLDRCPDRRCASLAFAGEDQCHSLRAQHEKCGAVVPDIRSKRRGPLGGQAHGGGITGVEGRVYRFRQDHDGTLEVDRRRLLCGGQEDLLGFGVGPRRVAI